MGVTNLDGAQFETHVKHAAEFAIDAVATASTVLIDEDAPERGGVQIRVGFHSGPVVSNVIGSLNPRYGLFGDTVNTASRFETNSESNKILCSHASAELLKAQAPSLPVKLRGKIKVKGKGIMMAYWIGNTHRYTPGLVPIPDCSESDEQSEITMEQSNIHHCSDFDLSSVGTRETEELISLAASDRSPNAQTAKSEVARQHHQLQRASDALISSLKEVVASRPENTIQTSPEDIKRIEDKLIGRGSVLKEIVDSIPIIPTSKPHHLDPHDVVLGKAVEQQLHQFVKKVSATYQKNGFHGLPHAMHVSSSAKAMLSRITSDDHHPCDDNPNSAACDLSYGISDDKLAQFAILFSALLHDIDHRGVPNFCLAKEDPDLANRYFGKAIAEQNSFDIGWKILMEPQFDDLRACIYASEEELLRFRQLVVNIVIATDVFDADLSKRRVDRWHRAFDPNHWSRALTSSETMTSGDDTSLKATVVLELLMQVSDIAHTMQHWNVYTSWNERLFGEMYSAYEAGRLPKDPSETWYEGELNFFDSKVIPLAKDLKACGILGDFSIEYLQLATENREHWEVEGKALVQNMIKKFNGNTSKQVRGQPILSPILGKLGAKRGIMQHLGGKSTARTVMPTGTVVPAI